MTDIAIQLPLPMSVTGTLMNLIGAAWPDAMIVDNQKGFLTGGKHMVLRIPDVPPAAVSDEQTAAAKVDPGEDDVDVLELGPQGVALRRPEELSAMMLQILRAGFEEHPDAVNYLENKVYDPTTHEEFVLIFARSKAQTPHELRMAAEKKLESAQANVHREVMELLLDLRSSPSHQGTFTDGVQACLDALREQYFSHVKV